VSGVLQPAKPIVKWAGGKTRLLPELLARLPSTFGRYFEPFAGGAAMFFRLAPEHAVLADANADLINAYVMVARWPTHVTHLIDRHAQNHCADWYREVRDAWNARIHAGDLVARAAAFLYLNRTCFNGLWRVNRRGEFNVPMGNYKAPLAGLADLLRTAAPALGRTAIRVGDYRDVVAGAVAGDLVYLDPPYDTISKTSSFTAYTADKFGATEQAEVASTVRALATRGVHVLVSNADTPLVRELYRGMRIDVVKCGRAINSKASKRGAVDEVIVTAG
jgi:DNA adenine methylase